MTRLDAPETSDTRISWMGRLIVDQRTVKSPFCIRSVGVQLVNHRPRSCCYRRETE